MVRCSLGNVTSMAVLSPDIGFHKISCYHDPLSAPSRKFPYQYSRSSPVRSVPLSTSTTANDFRSSCLRASQTPHPIKLLSAFCTRHSPQNWLIRTSSPEQRGLGSCGQSHEDVLSCPAPGATRFDLGQINRRQNIANLCYADSLPLDFIKAQLVNSDSLQSAANAVGIVITSRPLPVRRVRKYNIQQGPAEMRLPRDGLLWVPVRPGLHREKQVSRH